MSKDLLLPLRNLNVYGLDVHQDKGGQGLGVTETSRVLEAIGSASNPSLSRVVSGSAIFGHRALNQFGSSEAKDKYLKGILDGTCVNAVCLSDPSSGSDAMSTEVVLKDPDIVQDHFLLNGIKCWVSNATNADVFTGKGGEQSRGLVRGTGAY